MKSDRVRLEHIRDAILKIIEFAKDGPRNSKTEAAIMYEITVIGEAVKTLSSDLKTAQAHIPWRDIIGMRNKLVHEYFQTDSEVLWNTVTEDIPRLKSWIETLLSK